MPDAKKASARGSTTERTIAALDSLAVQAIAGLLAKAKRIQRANDSGLKTREKFSDGEVRQLKTLRGILVQRRTEERTLVSRAEVEQRMKALAEDFLAMPGVVARKVGGRRSAKFEKTLRAEIIDVLRRHRS